MGYWTWLESYEAKWLEGLLDEGYRLRFEVDPPPVPLRSMHTGRCWHPIHVGLTGQCEGGEPPAASVVWGGRNIEGPTMTSAEFVHAPEEVRPIARFLAETPFSRVAERLMAAHEAGVFVYSFGGGYGYEVLDAGHLERVYEELRAFYAEAAREGHVVFVHRG